MGIAHFFIRLLNRISQDVPDELAACLDCNKTECPIDCPRQRARAADLKAVRDSSSK